jgi:hypothetical protein
MLTDREWEQLLQDLVAEQSRDGRARLVEQVRSYFDGVATLLRNQEIQAVIRFNIRDACDDIRSAQEQRGSRVRAVPTPAAEDP